MRVVEPAQWLQTVQSAMAAGHAQFITFMGVDVDGTVQLWLRLRDADGVDEIIAVAATGAVPTLVELLPDVDWCEREAAEAFGIAFSGRSLAPLLLSGGAPAAMRKDQLLEARQTTPWPGEKDPGGTTPRRRTLPPGVAGSGR